MSTHPSFDVTPSSTALFLMPHHLHPKSSDEPSRMEAAHRRTRRTRRSLLHRHRVVSRAAFNANSRNRPTLPSPLPPASPLTQILRSKPVDDLSRSTMPRQTFSDTTQIFTCYRPLLLLPLPHHMDSHRPKSFDDGSRMDKQHLRTRRSLLHPYRVGATFHVNRRNRP